MHINKVEENTLDINTTTAALKNRTEELAATQDEILRRIIALQENKSSTKGGMSVSSKPNQLDPIMHVDPSFERLRHGENVKVKTNNLDGKDNRPYFRDQERHSTEEDRPLPADMRNSRASHHSYTDRNNAIVERTRATPDPRMPELS